MNYKKRLLWSMVLLSLLLLALGVWFYFTYYLSTKLAVERAEDFLFRRMKVAQLSEQQTYRYFYATNRRLETDYQNKQDHFGKQRQEKLNFGFFDVKIEPSLGLGMLINPTQWFQNEEIKLQQVQPLEQSELVTKVRRVVQDSPYQSLLVVVHGFREAFPSAMRKTAFLGHILDINSPVLLFDWPGNQGTSLGGYRRAHQMATASGSELAQSLMLIIREIQPQRLWLIANSMGAQVVVSAFGQLYQDADLADKATEIEEVVLTAPDIDHREFDNRFKQEINALASHLTVYVSSNDRALLMSRIINRGPRRGESTLHLDQLNEALKVAELVEPGSERVTLVDVTPVNRTRNFHNFSLETPEFFDDLYLRLTNTNIPKSRQLYQIRAPEGAVYWVLTPGR